MSINSDIRDGIIEIVRRAHLKGVSANGTNNTFSAEVIAVDTNARTCTVTSISSEVGMEYTNVMLMPQVDDGILYIPTIGSTVIVQNGANMQPYIIMWSQIDKVLYIVGDTEIQLVNGTATILQGQMQITLNNGKINISNEGQSLFSILQNMLNHILALTVPTGSGNSGTPLNFTDFNTDLQNLQNLMQ